MRYPDTCAKQKQFGAGEITQADEVLHDNSEERDGADESECYCHADNQRNGSTPSKPSTALSEPIYMRAPLIGLFVLAKLRGSRMKSLSEIKNGIIQGRNCSVVKPHAA